ncbi:MAG: ABC transporter ATP-binding protein [Kiritimatiellae bacterium]|nr:ABC transporter ATP-binding protein [Kiritimatiellia bacterium]
MGSEKALVAEGVCHSYGKGGGRCEVLKDFSLTLEKGAFMALMGPSGSGKSTFLHLAGALLPPGKGKIVVDGREITAMGDGEATRFRRRNIGIVFQAFNLVETLDVSANISLSARLDHKAPDSARVALLLETLGLSGKGKKFPDELSGGERQRVAVARALYAKPALILADEPTGNLDVHAAHSLCEILKSLNGKLDTAILLVTHDPMVAATANEVAFLKDGRIAAVEPTSHDPAHVSRRYLEMYNSAQS